jgi:hypothetical protein
MQSKKLDKEVEKKVKNATMKFAKSLKKDGICIEKKIKLTGLTKEEIKNL